MALFKNDAFVPDEWRRLARDATLPLDAKSILTLEQWRTHRDHLGASNQAHGLLLDPASDPRELGAEVARFSLIAIDFPKFSDGRGYSLARRVRDELGFTGELRAVGDILYDQLQLLGRCGFDAFEITHAATIALLESGRRPHLGIFYQPAAGSERGEPTRPWARRAAPSTS
jgi:phosphoadenosine phosphosulfate reductase